MKSVKVRWSVVAAAMAVFGIVESALAQLDEIVVTARKREESLQRVPLSVSAFSGVQLERYGVEEFFDLQYITPNLQLQDQLSATSVATVTIRGQSQAGILLTTDSSVGVYLDGINLPRTLGLRSNMFDIERVEVLKGPQGTLFGRNTTAGAINIISRKARHDSYTGKLSVTTGRFNRFDYSAAVNLPLVEDKLAVRFSGQRTFSDGYGQTLSGRELGDDNEWFGRASLVFDPGPQVNITLTADWQQVREAGSVIQLVTLGDSPAVTPSHITSSMIAAGIEIGALNPADIPRGGPPGPTFFPGVIAGFDALSAFIGNDRFTTAEGGLFFDGKENSANSLDAWGIGGTVSLKLGDVTLKSITGYRRFQRLGRVDLDATPFTILQSHLPASNEYLSEEVSLSGEAFGNRLTWLGGFFFNREEGTDGSRTVAVSAINPAVPSILDGDIVNRSWALYSENTLALTNRLDFTFGGRYTEETKSLTSRNRSGTGLSQSCNVPGGTLTNCLAEFEDAFSGFSWLFGVSYEASPNAFVYARTARGFRGGGQNLRGGSDPASFQEYDPEFARDVEVGLKSRSWNEKLQLNLAAFWTDYKDIQRSVIVPSTGANIVTILTNAASATILGFETEAVVSPIAGLRFTGSLGYTNAAYDRFVDIDPSAGLPIDRSGEPFGGPRWQLNLGMRYEISEVLPRGVLGAQLGWYWQSKNQQFLEITDQTFPRSLVDIEAYGLLNARLDYLVDDYGFEVAFFGENLTNKAYRLGNQDLTALGYLLTSVGKPRSWGIRLTKKFN